MQLAEAIGGNGCAYPIRRRCPNRHRTGAVFLPDLSRHTTRLDRNQVARLIYGCEAFERSTKAPGRRNGALGLATVAVLRCLALRFLNRKSGLCFPSYSALQKATGFCRATIAKALQALEAVGVLIVTRRMVRVRDDARGIVMTRQGSNVYRFQAMPALVPLPLCPAQPLKPRGFLSRVHGMDGNHRVPVQNLEQVAGEVGFQGEIVVTPQPKDWRERARLSIGLSMTRR